ncbi:MAG: response regulator transcription factor [Cyclobacteriaceae bacterium]|nr:response regulator transcription factor [Cyclobacteriaceae bacterium]
MKLTCVIVDDEPVARKGMADYVREVPFLELIGECSSAAECASILNGNRVDLLLLDIQMPGMTGIDFLKSLPNPPMAIFTTAFGEYALEGFALDVMDFLVKPVPFERFLKAVTKARDFYLMKSASDARVPTPDYLFVKSNGKYERVSFSEIQLVEGMQNYVLIHLPASRLIVYMTMTGMEDQLPKNLFMRVHKSYIVGLSHVKAIENHEILLTNHRVPVSRHLREEVMKRIMGDNLLKR